MTLETLPALKASIRVRCKCCARRCAACSLGPRWPAHSGDLGVSNPHHHLEPGEQKQSSCHGAQACPPWDGLQPRSEPDGRAGGQFLRHCKVIKQHSPSERWACLPAQAQPTVSRNPASGYQVWSGAAVQAFFLSPFQHLSRVWRCKAGSPRHCQTLWAAPACFCGLPHPSSHRRSPEMLSPPCPAAQRVQGLCDVVQLP